MKEYKNYKIILLTIVGFLVHWLIRRWFFIDLREFFEIFFGSKGISHFIAYIIVGAPIFLAVGVIHNSSKILSKLGFNRSLWEGLMFALFCTLPMFIGFGIVYDLNRLLTVDRVLTSVICAAIFEEVYFRGFLFGQLHRYSKLRFFPAVIISAIVFGIGHLYQGTEVIELVGIFMITFLGALLFSWVYVEWNYNIYVPLCLHLLMNLSWETFAISLDALGPLYPNIIRAVTVILIISLTLWRKRMSVSNMSVRIKNITHHEIEN